MISSTIAQSTPFTIKQALYFAHHTWYEVWDRGVVKSANDRAAVSAAPMHAKNIANFTYFTPDKHWTANTYINMIYWHWFQNEL